MSVSLERGLNAMKAQIDAPMASFFSSCVHCGLCAEACLFYTETQDPKYTPIHKLEPLRKIWWREFTLFGWLAARIGLAPPPTDAELKDWSELVYDSCTMCGRCSMVCPVGNDITMMIRKLREGMVAAGHAPPALVTATQRAVETGSPIGVRPATLQTQIRKQREEIGLEIPVDVEGADYLVILSSMETLQFPEIIGALARIFKQAKVTWTLPSEGFEATNVGIQIGSADLAKQLLERVVAAAERLKVKYVISPECGHAYTALRWDGPNLIGRPYSFKVVHIVELLDDLIKQGRIKLGDKDKRRLLLHDPCQIVRRGGVIAQPSSLLNAVAGNVVKDKDFGMMNWCCGGGGGVSTNDRAEHLRMKAFGPKKRQIEAAKPEAMVTACANCRNVLEEALDVYAIELPVLGLSELVAEHLDQTGEDK